MKTITHKNVLLHGQISQIFKFFHAYTNSSFCIFSNDCIHQKPTQAYFTFPSRALQTALLKWTSLCDANTFMLHCHWGNWVNGGWSELEDKGRVGGDELSSGLTCLLMGVTNRLESTDSDTDTRGHAHMVIRKKVRTTFCVVKTKTAAFRSWSSLAHEPLTNMR